MSSYPQPLSKDHKILEHEYCSGYTDNFGKWNTGFYCPQTDSMTAVYCCETPTFKYCCTIRQGNMDEIVESESFVLRTPVMVGIITGATLVLLFITLASCFFCSCCFVYKKRQAHVAGGLYRMQCSSSTASGLVNMYSPSSTSNHNSLATTPLDTEWSQQGQVGVMGQNHSHNLNAPGQLMTLSAGANGHGNGYPASLLSNGFPHNNNYNHITLPRYQNLPPPQHNNLPPPVFYPQNGLATRGAPYSFMPSNGNGTNFSGSTRQQLQPQQIHYPNASSQTTSRTQNQRIPGSILRVTNTNYTDGPNPGNSSLPPGNSFSGMVPGGVYRPTSEIITTGHPHGLQICTLPRRTASVISGVSSASSVSPIATRRPMDYANIGVGGDSANVNGALGSPGLIQSQLQGNNRSRFSEGPGPVCRANIQRLTSCLSSSDSQHQSLNAPAL